MHSRHNKKTYTSQLQKVKGIGEKKAAKLMLEYKTKENLMQASPEELSRTAGVNQETALELWKFIQEEF